MKGYGVSKPITGLVTAVLVLAVLSVASAQRGAPQVTSPEVSNDGSITFRLLAPEAKSVRVTGGDIPGLGGGGEMKKGENDVWEVTVGPVIPGAFRYKFNVDGMQVTDPANPKGSESNSTAWSLVVVPGSDLFDTREVPHGAVAEVTYYSSVHKRHRRMHVYTPPGYEVGSDKLAVFYLLHGASDSDDSWSSVGRAGFILDNLIADGKAKPMVMVMPNGHVGAMGAPGGEPFEKEFMEDIVPYIEKNYRVKTDRSSRAIAGLSMGGGQTLNIAIPNLEKFGYFGVFSSGVFGIAGGGRPGRGGDGPSFEERNKEKLDDPELKKGLELVWFGIGEDDFLLETSRATVKMLKKHNFDVVEKETDRGHVWINWRNYLSEFAPQLFR